MRHQSTPVLVIAYRRPDLVGEVMKAVAEFRPERLFLACDGPHPERPAEEALVRATREVMESAIDWPCEVRTRYSSYNQGCRVGVKSAIDWFFSEVDAGVILEDDCVPHQDFFAFCSELLERYADDPKVMHISGDGGLPVLARFRPDSYVFTRETLVWGWATWRRAWQHYDAQLEAWAAVRHSRRSVRAIYPQRSAAKYWAPILDSLLERGEPDTWDYQWSFTVRQRQGFAVVPTRNLVTNAGYRADATHTKKPGDPRAGVPVEPLGSLRHPDRLRLDARKDWAIQCDLRGFPENGIFARTFSIAARARNRFPVGARSSRRQRRT